jgi:hypothetical protein
MSWAKPFSFTLWLAVLGEVVICALIFKYVEGYGTNDGLPEPTRPIEQLLESLYFAVTMLLGAHDKGATTNAG